MLMHEINAENAANSSRPSAPLPRGPRGVYGLANLCLHIWTRVCAGVCVRGAAHLHLPRLGEHFLHGCDSDVAVFRRPAGTEPAGR